MEILAWGESQDRVKWTVALTAFLSGSTVPDMNPQGIYAFCPQYGSLTRADRVNFWAQLMSAICKPESNFDPACVERDDVGGTDSVGLLQLSSDDIQNYKLSTPPLSDEDLKDPIKNLRIAVLIMESKIVNLAQQFNGQDSDGHWVGMSEYWSTMCEGEDGYDWILDYMKALAPA